ncbi:MAG: formate dehydrogenase subunit gamma [Planctomycetota bacterium]|jgi:cytochrome b subunit of formate dehydrogenase
MTRSAIASPIGVGTTVAIAWLLIGAMASPAGAQAPGTGAPAGGPNQRCLNCHGQPHIGEALPRDRRSMVDPSAGPPAGPDVPETRPALYIEYESVYRFSAHGELTCTSCHTDCEELPHAARTEPARCDECHAQQQSEWNGSVHGMGIAGGDEYAARCSDCHGTHDILSSRNPQSRTYKLQLPYTCATCHANTRLMEQQRVHQPFAAEQYIDSMHGRGLIDKGLIVAPSCNDCHGVHNILPEDNPASSIHKDNVPHTCGACHIGIEQVYNQSIHGQLLLAGDERGPVCATCHTAHSIIPPSVAAFKLESDERCGDCHHDRLDRYRETFHGKAMALNAPGVAACYDCHGYHDVLPASDPESRLSADNRVETCRSCHPKANGNFANFVAHADHTDREHYPLLYWTFVFMTTIVVGTFVFFGIHTILWFLRSCVLYFTDPEKFRDLKIRAGKDDEEFVRFRPTERFLHGLVVISFLLLVATGMPLKFYYTNWAQQMVRFMGGLEVAGYLHRVGAVITFAYFAMHLTSLGKAALRNRQRFRNPKTGRFSVRQYLKVAFGPEMPLPTRADVRDWWAHQKWFFGRGPRPQFDRWTYWEKFDYFAVFWGVAIIGLSGLIMWFPEATTTFLPGWIINVALIVHSDEALLAAGFIFTFHFFNVHFRPEKFPMDPVIFSGRMSRTEMLHERKRWYDRLVATGQLDTMRVRDEWSQWKRVMHPLGFLAFGCGTLLLILIFYAMGSRLFGPGP